MIRKSLFIYFILTGFLLTVFNSGFAQNNNWTHFRGSNLDGKANVEKPPLKWSDDSNIKWKTEIHGKGWSSPVVFDNQIWITSAKEDGTELFAICTDFQTGKIIHDIK